MNENVIRICHFSNLYEIPPYSICWWSVKKIAPEKGVEVKCSRRMYVQTNGKVMCHCQNAFNKNSRVHSKYFYIYTDKSERENIWVLSIIHASNA